MCKVEKQRQKQRELAELKAKLGKKFKLIDKNLKLKLKEAKEIPNLDEGGCGILALAIQEFIYKNIKDVDTDGVYPRLKVLVCNWTGIDKFTIQIVSHCVVYFNKRYYDSTGDCTKSILDLVKNGEFNSYGIVTIPTEDLERRVKNTKKWNRSFSRISGTRTINKIFNSNIKLS